MTAMGIPTIWADAELIGEHVHIKISTGWQGGQDEMPSYAGGKGHFNNAGVAGVLTMVEEQWYSFIEALAVGGHLAATRVIWRLDRTKSFHVSQVMDEHGDWIAVRDNRYLWNVSDDGPAIVGTKEPILPWRVMTVPE